MILRVLGTDGADESGPKRGSASGHLGGRGLRGSLAACTFTLFCPHRPCGQCPHFCYSLTCRRTLVAAPSARTRSHGSNTRTASLLTFIYPPFTALGLLKLASVAQYRAAITGWLTLSIVPLCPPTSRRNLLQSSMDSLGPLLLLRVRTIGQRLFHRFGLYVTVSSPLPRAD